MVCLLQTYKSLQTELVPVTRPTVGQFFKDGFKERFGSSEWELDQ